MGDEGRIASAIRVVRGGSWNFYARNVRSAFRNHLDPDYRYDSLGFRCARAHDWAGWSGPEQTVIPGVPVGSPKPKATGVLVAPSGCPANARRLAAFLNPDKTLKVTILQALSMATSGK